MIGDNDKDDYPTTRVTVQRDTREPWVHPLDLMWDLSHALRDDIQNAINRKYVLFAGKLQQDIFLCCTAELVIEGFVHSLNKVRRGDDHVATAHDEYFDTRWLVMPMVHRLKYAADERTAAALRKQKQKSQERRAARRQERTEENRARKEKK